MGQYYSLTCPETGTYVKAHEMGSMLKALEQFWSTGMPASLAYLCSAGRGQHPRNMPWAPQGSWAGKMPLMIGDYAKNDDIANPVSKLPVQEPQIYDICVDQDARLSHELGRRKELYDLSSALMPIFERATGLRKTGIDLDGNPTDFQGFEDFFPVAKNDKGDWVLDLSGTPEDKIQDTIDYYNRNGGQTCSAWKRPPLRDFSTSFDPDGDIPDSIPAAEDGQGDALLWVNLDRLEFIDPAACGDVPDLVGIMNGDSARSVLAMLTYHERRGGGDFGETGPLDIVGRWRGDRIVLMGCEGFDGNSQEDVRKDYLDISANAYIYTILEDEYDSTGLDESETGSELTGLQEQALDLALRDPLAAKVIARSEQGRVSYRIMPKSILRKTPLKGEFDAPLTLAPTLDLYAAEGGRIRLSAETNRAIHHLLMKGRGTAVKITPKKQGRGYDVDCSRIITGEMANRHELVATLDRLSQAKTAQAA